MIVMDLVVIVKDYHVLISLLGDKDEKGFLKLFVKLCL